MNLNTTAKLTSTEIAALWTQYMNDTMSICFGKYALEIIEDPEIKNIYKTALNLSEKHVVKIKEFLLKEKFPIPYGFTEQDVNTKAPRLFLDGLFLNYLLVMIYHGMTGYSISLQVSSRVDIREYYTECNYETIKLYNEVMEIALSKGIYTRPPYIHSSEIPEMADKKFLTGWLGKRRALTAIEISNITFNMNKTYLSKAISMAFAQVANDEKVKRYLQRGLKLSTKITEVFNSFFLESNLNFPVSWESMVTNSTTSPFSDKLIMFHIGFLSSAAVGFYGAGQATCMRRDLSAQYLKLIGEQLLFSEDGAELMLERGWFEKPPMAEDRNALMMK
ncbi:DUF3231 family protein [Paenibacillus sp. HWE-109]|uniref:DUF3231 family protein n=1 Tax=Paenibacillus sp. HWE-109 TaxID=1306526 RepID=UPI001EDF28B9|nr:DUF3231 family protein [Paenibacillus sp. HWE-109]UKS28100.1 DUF3231 family protein [Paenibacillus sp. HWE-109]